MAEIDLKHYDDYLERLTNFADAIGVKIRFTKYDNDDAKWSPAKSTISLDEDMSQTDMIASFLHELGHALADLVLDTDQSMIEAYSKIYDEGRYTKKHKKIVIAIERQAWYIGRLIAARLKIKLGAWFTQCQKDSLNSYVEKSNFEKI